PSDHPRLRRRTARLTDPPPSAHLQRRKEDHMRAPPLRARRAGRRDDTRLALLFILPASIGLVTFYFWPMLRGLWLSLTSWDLLSPAEFAGLQNYRDMMADPVLWNAVRVSAIYVVINVSV